MGGLKIGAGKPEVCMYVCVSCMYVCMTEKCVYVTSLIRSGLLSILQLPKTSKIKGDLVTYCMHYTTWITVTCPEFDG